MSREEIVAQLRRQLLVMQRMVDSGGKNVLDGDLRIDMRYIRAAIDALERVYIWYTLANGFVPKGEVPHG